jgi:hypothetical protein
MNIELKSISTNLAMQYKEIYYKSLKENIKDDFKDQLTSAWHTYFPNSRISITNGAFGGEDFNVRCILSKDNSQLTSGIVDNDPLSFSLWVWDNSKKESIREPSSPDWTVEISQNHILIPPENKYLAYSSKRIPVRGAKHVSLEKAIQIVEKSFGIIRKKFDELVDQDLICDEHRKVFDSAK